MVEPLVEPHGGVGFSLINKRGERYFEHGGWNEGFCGEIIGHARSGKGVVILINANQPDFMHEVVRSVMRAYDWPGVSPPHKQVPMDPSAMRSLTGRYKGGSDYSVNIVVRDGKLFREPLREPATELVHIGEGVFVSRMDERRRRFVPDSTGSMTLRVSDGEDGEVLGTLPRMKDNEFVPFELVQRGDRDAALKAYTGLLAADPNDEAVNEQRLNMLGYELMNTGKVEQARDLFYINMKLYPKSSNVYDSYAEACLKLGDKREALIHYKRAAQMDPNNANAASIAAELERERIKSE
jgi:hypothetical protein